MDYLQMTSPCGRDCFNCPVYIAENNERLKKRIARNFNIPIDQASCKGCRNEKGIIGFVNMKDTCAIFRCTRAKKIDFCCECEDFPCDHLHPLADRADQFPHNTKVFNLCLIKKMGLEQWAETKAKEVYRTYHQKKLKDLFGLSD